MVANVVSGEDVFVGGSMMTTMMIDEGVARLCVHVVMFCENATGVYAKTPK